MTPIGNQWDELLAEEFAKPYYQSLVRQVEQEYETATVYPPKDKVFAALKTVDYDKARVVILGQDPYHEPNQANGMAFAVSEGVDLPPSLKNIFQELESDIGIRPQGSTLIGWAEQGVLLLNATLTVRRGEAQSHGKLGWQTFTDAVIAACSKRDKPMVFILWGAYAGSKKPLIDKKHLIIESAHPSPLSAYRGFFGSKPFSRANAFLKANGEEEIDWAKVDAVASYYRTSRNIRRV